jgi:hypothetical protein
MGSLTHPRRWLAGSAVAITITATAIAASAIGTASAATGLTHKAGHIRPAAAHSVSRTTSTPYPVEPVTQEFGSNTSPFCPAATGNAPCDGAANDYGTIDRVPSGFSNGGVGNYAPFTKALTGGWMALVSGTTVRNQGGGCPSTAVEACTGPYALFGTGKAMGVENVFPTNGFTVTNDLYLSPKTAAPGGALVDDDVELNTSAGGYGIDNIITACAENTVSKGFGFVINFGHNSPGSCADTSTAPVINTNGWYRFVFYFTDIKGDAYVNEEVLSESTGKAVIWSGRRAVGGGAPEPISKWGGPGYFWLPTEQFAGLPMANFALQLGYVVGGHKP